MHFLGSRGAVSAFQKLQRVEVVRTVWRDMTFDLKGRCVPGGVAPRAAAAGRLLTGAARLRAADAARFPHER